MGVSSLFLKALAEGAVTTLFGSRENGLGIGICSLDPKININQLNNNKDLHVTK